MISAALCRALARDVRKLEVFGAADALLFEAMAVAATLDAREHRAICDQLRRAALSVPLNLVEGAQRTTTKEFGRFVEIATGSAAEARYLLSVASRLQPDHPHLVPLERSYESLVRRLHRLRCQISESSPRPS